MFYSQMQPLSMKELDYIADSISNEEMLSKLCAAAAAVSQNFEIEQAMLEHIRVHEHHLHLLTDSLRQHQMAARRPTNNPLAFRRNSPMNPMDNQELLPQNDLLKSILADLRRTVREYTTATTESSCPAVRQLFTELTNSTLRLQGTLYELMKHQGIYTAPAPAPRQLLDKKLQEAEKTQQELRQFTDRRASRWTSHAHQANVEAHRPNVQPPYYI